MVKSFNDSLDVGCVVAVEDRFDNDGGHTRWAIIWDGNQVNKVCVLSGYIDLGRVYVDATPEQKKEAVKWWVDNAMDTKGFFDCVVKLKRSRKAPNNTELKVFSYREAYFDSVNYRDYPAQIIVNVEGDLVPVSASCVSEIVKGRLPSWA